MRTMMRRKMLFFLCYVACQVASQEIKETCEEFYDFPPTSNTASPSKVADLKVVQVTKGGEIHLNVSWAINVDASNKYLTGTYLEISGKPCYLCKYNPHFAEANLTGSEQKWFHFLTRAYEGFYEIRVSNVPLSPSVDDYESMYEITKISPLPKSKFTTPEPIAYTNSEPTPQVDTSTESPSPEQRYNALIIVLVGLMIMLIVLSSCCIFYKYCIPISTSYLRVKSLPMVPVSVLVVYPAENSAFQRAVVALAEFLQLHGGCSVAIDMWQQGKIAELGPLRWLAEQAKAADRVLIISPQAETPSLLLSQSMSNHNLPEHSIPAAAHDLYPLIRNMVASHAKSASELSKFWVVHLNKKSCVFLPELKACRSFCLMKDLKKLCESIHTPKNVGKKISLLFKPRVSYSKNSSTKLREAIEMLGGV